MLLLVSADFFLKKNQIYSGTQSRVANSLNPDQGQRSVGPDLGQNCLQ